MRITTTAPERIVMVCAVRGQCVKHSTSPAHVCYVGANVNDAATHPKSIFINGNVNVW